MIDADSDAIAEPMDFGSDEPAPGMPAWVTRMFAWIWAAITGTRAGLVSFLVLIYVIPYGLALASIGTQITSGGDFAILAFAALISSTFASAQPAPTPLLGTLSLVLAGFLGAFFDPLAVGLVAGIAGTAGLVTSYGVGAAGIGRLLIDKMKDRPSAMKAITRAFAVIRRRGAWAILVLTFLPNPLYAWSSVAAGASRTPFPWYFAAATVGSVARFVALAYLGHGIEGLVG